MMQGELHLTVGRIAFEHPLPDMRGQPPAVAVKHSIDAADKFKPHMNRKEREVFDYIASLPTGCTDNELIHHFNALGWSGNTPRARRVALRDKNLVVQAGSKEIGGYWSAVWVVDSTNNKEAI